MYSVRYDTLSDADKLDLLRLLYHDIKDKEKATRRDIEQKELLIQETQRVYSRLKLRSH